MEEDKSKKTGQSLSYPNQDDVGKAMASIASLLREAQQMLPVLRREFRGEALQQYEDGSFEYIQVSKPYFIKINETTEKPLKIKVKYRNGIEKEIYVPNDEAIEEVLGMLKSMGLNQITLLTNLDENTILDDLREFECKLAGVLCLKQKQWGIDKELMPMVMIKIKTLIQDARYQACNGNTIKAIQKTVQRVEQYYEGDKGGKKISPYN